MLNMMALLNHCLLNMFQSRCRMMEVYNKQSLKAVQQHVSLLNMQVTKYRSVSMKLMYTFDFCFPLI